MSPLGFKRECFIKFLTIISLLLFIYSCSKKSEYSWSDKSPEAIKWRQQLVVCVSKGSSIPGVNSKIAETECKKDLYFYDKRFDEQMSKNKEDIRELEEFCKDGKYSDQCIKRVKEIL